MISGTVLLEVPGSRAIRRYDRPSATARSLLHFGVGFSCAGIAVESRLTCPTILSPINSLTNASCIRPGRLLSANSAKAREKVDSLGISWINTQPHRFRIWRSTLRRSTRSLVVGMSHIAFAIKARTKLIRSHKGRPSLWEILRVKSSGQIIPSAITKRW